MATPSGKRTSLTQLFPGAATKVEDTVKNTRYLYLPTPENRSTILANGGTGSDIYGSKPINESPYLHSSTVPDNRICHLYWSFLTASTMNARTSTALVHMERNDDVITEQKKKATEGRDPEETSYVSQSVRQDATDSSCRMTEECEIFLCVSVIDFFRPTNLLHNFAPRV